MYYVAKVEGKRMWDDPKDIAPIIADLEKNKDQITGIELSSNSIGIECGKVLANAIQNITKPSLNSSLLETKSFVKALSIKESTTISSLVIDVTSRVH